MLERSGLAPATRAFGELVAKTRRLPDAGISILLRLRWASHGEPKSREKQDEQSQKKARSLLVESGGLAPFWTSHTTPDNFISVEWLYIDDCAKPKLE
jgi:hypothetical protein